MRAYHFGAATSEEPGAGFIDTGEVAIHVAGVNDIGGLFDNAPIMTFEAVPLREPSHLYQQFLVAKGNRQIIIGARSQAGKRFFLRFIDTAYEEHGDVGRVRFTLELPAQLNAIEHRHAYITDHNIRLEGGNEFERAAAIAGESHV